MGFADVEKSGAHFLTGDVLYVVALQAESLLIVRDRIFQRMHRDSKVINSLQHGLMIVLRCRSGKNKFR